MKRLILFLLLAIPLLAIGQKTYPIKGNLQVKGDSSQLIRNKRWLSFWLKDSTNTYMRSNSPIVIQSLDTIYYKDGTYETTAPVSFGVDTLVDYWLEPVISRLAAPPTLGVADSGNRYMVSSTPSGAWGTKANLIATWDTGGTAWSYYTPLDKEGVIVLIPDARTYAYVGTYPTGVWRTLSSPQAYSLVPNRLPVKGARYVTNANTNTLTTVVSPSGNPNGNREIVVYNSNTGATRIRMYPINALSATSFVPGWDCKITNRDSSLRKVYVTDLAMTDTLVTINNGESVHLVAGNGGLTDWIVASHLRKINNKIINPITDVDILNLNDSMIVTRNGFWYNIPTSNIVDTVYIKQDSNKVTAGWYGMGDSLKIDTNYYSKYEIDTARYTIDNQIETNNNQITTLNDTISSYILIGDTSLYLYSRNKIDSLVGLKQDISDTTTWDASRWYVDSTTVYKINISDTSIWAASRYYVDSSLIYKLDISDTNTFVGTIHYIDSLNNLKQNIHDTNTWDATTYYVDSLVATISGGGDTSKWLTKVNYLQPKDTIKGININNVYYLERDTLIYADTTFRTPNLYIKRNYAYQPVNGINPLRENISIGYMAGSSLKNSLGAAHENVLIGVGAGQNIKSNKWWSGGSWTIEGGNVAIGYHAGYADTSSFGAVMIGRSAGLNNLNPNRGIFIGNGAGENSQGRGICIGDWAGRDLTSDNSGGVFIGDLCGVTNTTGSDNTFIGNTCAGTGSYNTLLGTSASSGAAYQVTALGYDAGGTGSNSTLVGANCGKNASGVGNTFIGQSAGYGSSSGGNNVLVGQYSGENGLGAGQDNCMIGTSTGQLTVGSNNLFLGSYAGRNITTYSNRLVISSMGTYNTGRVTLKSDTGNAIIHGIQADSSYNQRLDLNANVVIKHKLSIIPQDTMWVTASQGIDSITSSVVRVLGNGSAVDVTANPQIEAGYNGQLIEVWGEDGTNTVTLNDGNGLQLNGATFVLTEGAVIVLRYFTNPPEWREVSRSPN